MRPLCHCWHICRISPHLTTFNNKTQKQDLVGMEFAFLCFRILVVQQPLFNLTNMCLVFLQVLRKDQDIIEIDQTKRLRTSRRTLLIRAWKTAGALVRPNDITRYSIHTRWYALRSSLVNQVAPWRGVKVESIRCNWLVGWFFTVMLFSPL